MRVQDSNLNSVTIGTNQSCRADEVRGGRAGTTVAQGSSITDRISISDLSSLVRSVSGDTAGRAEKVTQLAAAYKAGGYRVDAGAVSKGIVNDAFTPD